MKKLPLFSIIAFALSYGVMTVIHQVYHSKQHAFIKSESQAIQNQIEERFKLYVRSTLAIRNIAAEFWKRPVITSQEFHALGASVLEIYPEFIGANFVQPDGLISLVHPPKENSPALGKITQNLVALRKAGDPAEGVWMSPPFDLFQGRQGFVYYFRLKRGKAFVGWYGIVVSQDLFLKHFLTNKQFENFNIKMTDTETNRDYLSTDSLPANFNEEHLRTNTFKVLGRTINLKTWPKNSGVLPAEWISITFIALIFTLLASMAWNFFHQKIQSKKQINELNLLLGHIIHDTANSVSAIKGYVELMREDPKLVPVDRLTRNVSFVVELIDQIKLVRGLAGTDTSWEQSTQSLLPLVIESVEFVSDKLNEKALGLNYDPETLGLIQVNLNQNLFVHAVLSRILNTLIKFSKTHTSILLRTSKVNDKYSLTLSIPSVEISMEKSDEMSMRIAKQVMEIQGGELEYSLASGMEVTIFFS